jgi:hypothetical protein
MYAALYVNDDGYDDDDGGGNTFSRSLVWREIDFDCQMNAVCGFYIVGNLFIYPGRKIILVSGKGRPYVCSLL